MGIAGGRRPAFTGLLVDQDRLWADPHATRLIFLPTKHRMLAVLHQCILLTRI